MSRRVTAVTAAGDPHWVVWLGEDYEFLEIAHMTARQEYYDQGPRWGEPQDTPGLNWMGPLPATTMERVRKFLPINVLSRMYIFQSWHYQRCSDKAKRYWGGRTTWCYQHCSGSHRLGLPVILLIRKVLPSPEIHVVMQPWRRSLTDFVDRRTTHNVVSFPDGEHGTELTAVAENDRHILTDFVDNDKPCGYFLRRVKERCIEIGMCTRQTNLTIYWDNVPMSPDMMLRRRPEDYHRHRLPKIIYAEDGSLHTTPRSLVKEEVCPETPQSRTEEELETEVLWSGGSSPEETPEDTESQSSTESQNPQVPSQFRKYNFKGGITQGPH